MPPLAMRVGPHPALALRGQLPQLGYEPAALVEELLGPVTAHPGLEDFEVLGVLGRLGERDLMRPVSPLDRQAIDYLGAGPTLGRLEDDHRPARPLGDAPLSGVRLDLADLGDDLVERRGHELVHRLRLVPLDEVGRVAVAAQELLQLLVADAGQDRRVVDLVAVQVEDRQHGPIVRRVEELVGVPARGQRAGLGLAVAHDAGDNQIRVVERRAEGVAQAVAQLAPLVDRARRLGSDVTGDAAREGELLEELLHPRHVLGDVRVDLAVSPLQVHVADQRRPAVAGSRDVDHVQVIFLDDPIQMDVEEVLPRSGPPVAQQPRFDVLELQRLAQERVVIKVDLADREVIGGPPVGVHLAEEVRRERGQGGAVRHRCPLAARGLRFESRLHRLIPPSVLSALDNSDKFEL